MVKKWESIEVLEVSAMRGALFISMDLLKIFIEWKKFKITFEMFKIGLKMRVWKGKSRVLKIISINSPPIEIKLLTNPLTPLIIFYDNSNKK